MLDYSSSSTSLQLITIGLNKHTNHLAFPLHQIPGFIPDSHYPKHRPDVVIALLFLSLDDKILGEIGFVHATQSSSSVLVLSLGLDRLNGDLNVSNSLL
jgi:hypothetical protein